MTPLGRCCVGGVNWGLGRAFLSAARFSFAVSANSSSRSLKPAFSLISPTNSTESKNKFLTGTRGDVALLVLLRRAQAGLTSVLGLWVGAGALAATDPPAAVPAALGPGAPRGPAAVQRVAGHPPEAKNLPCWTMSALL